MSMSLKSSPYITLIPTHSHTDWITQIGMIISCHCHSVRLRELVTVSVIIIIMIHVIIMMNDDIFQFQFQSAIYVMIIT